MTFFISLELAGPNQFPGTEEINEILAKKILRDLAG